MSDGSGDRERLIDRPVIEPAGGAWASLIASAPGPNDQRAQRFREQLGLPIAGPIVMTGHQAQWWHPGILAKYLAVQHAARSLGGTSAWLVVDQDINDPTELRYPGLDAGRIVEKRWVIGSTDDAQHTTGGRGPIEPSDPPSDLHPAVDADALERVRHAMRAHRGSVSLAQQIAGALADLASPVLEPAPMVFASELARTNLFVDLVERMKHDAAACIGAYNEAAAVYPRVQIRPLVLRPDEDRVELPMWHLRGDGSRSAVFLDQLGEIPIEQLAPRALLMTAIVRLAGCELFVHGTGGGAYDQITQRWIERWLGERLAPTAVVSATVRLPLIDGPTPTPQLLADARALAHNAQHNPAIIGDTANAKRKAELLAQIERDKAQGRSPRAAFDAMHAMLDGYRAAHAAELASLRARAEEVAGALASVMLATDRTWAFVLHDAQTMGALADQIAHEMVQPAPTTTG